ncbi:MAG: polyamine aminopropyltransferase [Dehalococcoidia bacterium]|nr:polyamine aminopropyltransferase [Dehalococcoidia bacterium]
MTELHFQETDPFAPIRHVYDVEEIICSRRTKHQQLLIFKSSYFGRVLVLDGVVQLTERDEHLYHEMLTHVALHAHPHPTEVLIVGGGDGGSLREVLKHNSVRRVKMVELDLGVTEASKEFLPTLSTGFADPRADILEAKGEDYLAQTGDRFDVVIMDSTDPVGPAAALFADECLANAAGVLKDDGIFVGQTESLHFHLDFVREVQRKLATSFRIVDLYTVPLATYGGNWWTFSIASKVYDPRELQRACEIETRFYAADVHRQAFLTPSLRRRLLDSAG